jgi:hypothetical protein
MRATLVGLAITVAVVSRQGWEGIALLIPIAAALAVALLSIQRCEARTEAPPLRLRHR